MRNFFLSASLIFLSVACKAQKNIPSINAKEVERIERMLASDSMQGRRTGTEGIAKAEQFIAAEFAKAGLQPLAAGGGFLQSFSMITPKLMNLKAELDDVDFNPQHVMVITSKRELKVNEKSGFRVTTMDADLTDRNAFFAQARKLVGLKENLLVYVDSSLATHFSRLPNLKRQMFKTEHDVVFILGKYQPKEFTIKAEHSIDEMKLNNVVGILPGKSRKEEFVIFSAHHDHLGIGRPQDGDSIYNGANDDAAGTTAVIMLADHFKKLNNNERTLVFVTFTAEEMGGFGSQYFSRQFKPEQVAAMFNIEMIGTESKWGKNSAYITGYEMSDMGSIMQKNLQGTGFTFQPDPYPTQQLFYRSDNATLARLGVPAHTISTAKMEGEPYYHKASDEVSTLDLANMTEIIKAIALSSATIVSGKETPARVKTENLR